MKQMAPAMAGAVCVAAPNCNCNRRFRRSELLVARAPCVAPMTFKVPLGRDCATRVNACGEFGDTPWIGYGGATNPVLNPRKGVLSCPVYAPTPLRLEFDGLTVIDGFL